MTSVTEVSPGNGVNKYQPAYTCSTGCGYLPCSNPSCPRQRALTTEPTRNHNEHIPTPRNRHERRRAAALRRRAA